MRTQVKVFIHSLMALGAAGAIGAQITANPLPAPVEKHGLMVEIREVARL